MIRESSWRYISFASMLVAVAACGGTQKPTGGKSEASREFERCRVEEAAGPASGCWKHFVENFGNTASSAELMIAKEHASGSPKTSGPETPPPPPPPPAPAPTPTVERGVMTHETPAQQPPPPPPAPPPQMTANIIADLLAIPDAGSSAWDDAVEARLLHEYDTNHSRKIDSDAELQKMPCQAWMALESRLWSAKNISVSRLYGFAPGFAWVGNALGFAEPMRVKTFDRMKTCGVDPTHAPRAGQVPTAPSTPAASASGLVGELAAIPNAGSSEWDTAVKARMLRSFDDNHSGEIERETELKKIPCNVFTTLESRLQAQQHISVARLYGFAPGFGWVGNALGFGQPLREKAYAAMRACGVDTGSPAPAAAAAPSSAAPAGPILADLIAIPDAGSTPWDHAVKARLLREYDTNHNNEIDTDAELQKIPCTIFTALEVRLQAAQHIAVSRLYGFAPNYSWVGNALGFSQSLREKTFAKMRSCSLP